MRTHYKVREVGFTFTYIDEYWDDLHIYTYRVDMHYNGGDVVEFLRKWPHYRNVRFDNLEEFLRRTIILYN